MPTNSPAKASWIRLYILSVRRSWYVGLLDNKRVAGGLQHKRTASSGAVLLVWDFSTSLEMTIWELLEMAMWELHEMTMCGKHPKKCLLYRAVILATFALKREAYDDLWINPLDRGVLCRSSAKNSRILCRQPAKMLSKPLKQASKTKNQPFLCTRWITFL